MLHSLKQIIKSAQACSRLTLAVAWPHDRDVIESVYAAKQQGLAEAIMVGDPRQISEICKRLAIPHETFRMVPSENEQAAAARAVALIREARAHVLMKGLISTADLLRAVLSRENGLRTGNLLSHVMFYEIPGFTRLLINTDGGVLPFPTLEQKIGIAENAVTVLRRLGYDRINLACLCGAEQVNPDIQSTVDAAKIAAYFQNNPTQNVTAIGPVGLDLAISPQACEHKNYRVPGCADADILLMPNYEVGNVFGKCLTYFAGAKSAGMIVGAQAPIVLVSRADNAQTKLQSIALACLYQQSLHGNP